ncbi:MAG: hypothetical protein RBU37_01620 [Myxococcota bacterium]|jgi:hypothetical protein|nr:hypothetical protein [Myxococcota bacterium]
MSLLHWNTEIGLCKRAALAMLVLCSFCVAASPAVARDSVSCTRDDDDLLCTVELEDFLNEIRPVLNNGWENLLEFNLMLFEVEDETFVGHNFTELSARCYIDPFDDPCLALWSGSESWQSYEDVDEMILGISNFRLVSQGASELSGRYFAKLTVALNPITDKQADVIRTWLARHRGGHMIIGRSDASIFGTFVSVFANIRSGKAEASKTIDSEVFELP